MQREIVINPTYSGPVLIEDYFRKMKAQGSLARMVSSHNKRYFVLDFKNKLFYYLPEKGANISSSAEIPLDSITRIYIDEQLNMLDDDKIWKHGFCLITKKRIYRLVSHSREIMERMLFGLSNFLDVQTKTPLFDWASYKQAYNDGSNSEVPLQFNHFSPKDQGEISVVNTFSNRSQNNVNQQSNQTSSARKVPKQLEEPLNHQQEERPRELGTPYTQPSTPPSSNEDEDRQGALLNNNAQDIKDNSQAEEDRTFRQNRPVAMKISIPSDQSNKEDELNDQITNNIEMQNGPGRVEPSKSKVEALNIEEQFDKPDIAVVPGSLQIRRASSNQRETPRRVNISQFGFNGTPKSSLTKAGESARFNGQDALISQRKSINPNFWNDTQEVNKESESTATHKRSRDDIKTNDDKTMNIGNGILVSLPTFDESQTKQSLPSSYLNMMQEAKKCSPLVDVFSSKKNDNTQSRIGNTQNTLKNNVGSNDDGDDWDKDMFGDEYDTIKGEKQTEKSSYKDKDQSSGYPLEATRNTSEYIGTQDNKTNKSKNLLQYKQSEMFASKEDMYNDWDDDL